MAVKSTALSAFRPATSALRGFRGVDEYCQTAIRHTAELLGVSRCAVVLVRDGYLHAAAATGLPGDYVRFIQGCELTDALGTWGEAIRANQPTFLRDLACRPTAVAVRKQARMHDLRGCWKIPLRAGSGPSLGALSLYPDGSLPPSAEQLTLAATLAELLALGIQDLQTEREADGTATVDALMAALDSRDAYTAEHSDATAELALSVGERIGLSRDEQNVLECAAVLHDIGKLTIPDSVLHHPDQLDYAQAEIMRTHPRAGAAIVGHVPGMGAVALAVLHEHERWDGLGYPSGLTGNQIPIASRIVLACDAYHAMTSDRPYRPAMSEAEAIAELRRHAGTQFDPQVVNALLDALRALRAATPSSWRTRLSAWLTARPARR